ncbi:MAG: hypothetical protein ACFFD4_21595 [Candidatus Odinarchaeota archaeon]
MVDVSGPNLFRGPPFILDLNLPVTISVYGLILLAMVLTGTITAMSAKKANIVEILRSE